MFRLVSPLFILDGYLDGFKRVLVFLSGELSWLTHLRLHFLPPLKENARIVFDTSVPSLKLVGRLTHAGRTLPPDKGLFSYGIKHFACRLWLEVSLPLSQFH